MFNLSHVRSRMSSPEDGEAMARAIASRSELIDNICGGGGDEMACGSFVVLPPPPALITDPGLDMEKAEEAESVVVAEVTFIDRKWLRCVDPSGFVIG